MSEHPPIYPDERGDWAAANKGYARHMAKKRGYTYDYTPKSEKHGRYLLDKIPADLWRRVKAKAKRDGVSVRATILRLLTEWVER